MFLTPASVGPLSPAPLEQEAAHMGKQPQTYLRFFSALTSVGSIEIASGEVAGTDLYAKNTGTLSGYYSYII